MMQGIQKFVVARDDDMARYVNAEDHARYVRVRFWALVQEDADQAIHGLVEVGHDLSFAEDYSALGEFRGYTRGKLPVDRRADARMAAEVMKEVHVLSG
jgi:hypothetical protein